MARPTRPRAARPPAPPARSSTATAERPSSPSRTPARRDRPGGRLARAQAGLRQAGQTARGVAAANHELATLRLAAGRRRESYARAVSLANIRQLVQRARDRRLGRRAIAALIVALLASVALAWVALFSPWLAVRQLQLVGNDRFSATELQAIAAADIGRPLARVDTDALAAAVATSPSVKEAQVVRVWPSTLEVRVTERIPVAAVPRSDSVDLMAADGVVVETVDKAPAGLPAVTEETVAGGESALVAAAEVLDSLPPQLRARVPQAGAATRDSVQFELMVPAPVEESPDGTADEPGTTDAGDGTAHADGVSADSAHKPTPVEPEMIKVTVMWGSPEESALKAEVLGVLLKTPAKEYDVSSPQTPVTR